MKREGSNASILAYAGLLLFAIALTFALYGSAVRLPFFFDDLDHFPYIIRTTLPEIWQSSGGFPYFRPLGATIWRISYLLLGENNAAVLHTLNLLLHGGNGFLVGLLYKQLITRHAPPPLTHFWHTFIPTTLFILYPFSYQAVPWIGALYHLLVTTLILLALVSHGRYIASGRKRWLMLGLMAATLAPFAHENGVLIFPLIVLITLLTQSPIQNPKSKLIWLLPLFIWFPIWYAAPKERTGNLTVVNLEAIWQNSAYFLQGLAFPFTWLGGMLRDYFGWNDLWTAVGLSLFALLIAFLMLRTTNYHSALKPHPLTLFLLPIIFFFLTAAPAILLLDFAYNISSPRLQMLPSVGAALLWGNVLTAVTRRQLTFSKTADVRIALVLTGFAILPSAFFIRRHMVEHKLLGAAWQQAAEITTQANAQDRPVIFINLPASLTHPTTFFPLGHEGTVFMVPYIHPDRIIDTNTGRTAAFDLRRYDDIRPEMPYLYGVLGDARDWPQVVAENPQALIYNTLYQPQRIFLEAVGGIESQTTTNWQMQAPAYDLQLVDGYGVLEDPQTLTIHLQWQTAAPLPWEITTFVHIVDESGGLITQADGHAWANTYPLAQWPPNTIITDSRSVTLAQPHANLSVRIGLYNWMTGERIPLQTAAGEPIPDNAFTIPVK